MRALVLPVAFAALVGCNHSSLPAASSSSTLWAVGGNLTSGSIGLKWSGDNWTRTLPFPSTTMCSGVWGTSDHDVWTVGYAAIGHFDGKAWSACGGGNPFCGSSGTTHPLVGIFGLSGTDIWAVGEDEAIHWDGSRWESQNGGVGNESLQAVWCASTSDCWAASFSGRVLHWDGAAWGQSAQALAQPARGLWGTASDDVWVVGNNGPTGGAAHWDGSSWSQPITVQPRLNGLWGTAPDDIWAVGDGGAIVRWNGAAWTTISSPTTNDLHGVWGSSSSDLWLVGVNNDILHWNGSAWTSTPVTFDEPTLLFGVWGSLRD